MPKPKSAKKAKKSAKDDFYTKILTSFQRNYYQEYLKAGVDPIDSVRRTIRTCLEGEKGAGPIEKLYIEPPSPHLLKPRTPKATDSDIIIPEKAAPMSGLAVSVCLPPLCNAIENQAFTMVQEMYFWGFPFSLLSATRFADMLTTMNYPVQVLEFEDCDLCPESINRLAVSFTKCEFLRSLSFDYNTLDLFGLEKLLTSLTQCRRLLDLSLCYCALDSKAGKLLGRFAAQNLIRNLFLDGNDLEISGVIDFFGELMAEFDRIDAQLEAVAAAEAALAANGIAAMDMDLGAITAGISVAAQAMMSLSKTVTEGTSSAGGKKKKKKKRSKSRKKKNPLEEVLPPPGPWLRRLHLADTFGGFSQIEHYRSTTASAPENQQTCQAIDCVKVVKTIGNFIVKCAELEELDIYNNWLNNCGGIILLNALQKRAAAEMTPIGMKINRGVDGAILKNIFKMASGVKKKKRRRRSSKKK